MTLRMMASPPIYLPEVMTGDAARKKKKTKAALARNLSILVGLCGSLVLLASTSSDSILRDARSTIIPRLLAAVADGDEVEEGTVPPPLDEDDEAPMNLTSTYQDHEERMTERRLASPAPPSSDIVPNEYIVGIKPWGLAYPMLSTATSGYCYIANEVKGTFYARDNNGRCFKIQVSEGGNLVQQTGDPVAASQCTDTNNPSSYDFRIGSLYSKYSYYIRYINGDSCSNGPRKATIYFRYNKNLAFSEYTTSVSEPYMCDYRIYITVPGCVAPSDWTYRYSTYDGVQQATALMNKVGGGGSINQIYQYSLHGFSATLSSSQVAALRKELIVDFVEPNYVVHSRGINNDGNGGNAPSNTDVRRNLAIPMFNVKEPAAHWGLERLSSRGGKNGKYLYFHIGEKTHLYIFDTAINENHDEFWPFDRFGNETERHVCTGSPGDYLENNHGTHVASLAAGMNYGTARNATIHPVQVLDATGKGTTTSVLCGVEWLINDQLQYNYANEVDEITNEGTGPRKSIASITWGTNGRSDVLDMAIGNLAKVGGVPAVVAAGNDGGKWINVLCDSFARMDFFVFILSLP